VLTQGTCLVLTQGTWLVLAQGTCLVLTQGTCLVLTQGTWLVLTQGTWLVLTQGYTILRRVHSEINISITKPPSFISSFARNRYSLEGNTEYRITISLLPEWRPPKFARYAPRHPERLVTR